LAKPGNQNIIKHSKYSPTGLIDCSVTGCSVANFSAAKHFVRQWSGDFVSSRKAD